MEACGRKTFKNFLQSRLKVLVHERMYGNGPLITDSMDKTEGVESLINIKRGWLDGQLHSTYNDRTTPRVKQITAGIHNCVDLVYSWQP